MPRNRKAYLQSVADFIASKGPQFELVGLEFGASRACDCCGYHPIKAHYTVKGAQGLEYVIGSECQTWVLDFDEAHLPAARVRVLSAAQLVKLGTKYNLVLDETLGKVELAKLVIAGRRKHANVAGWISRRNQGKAPAKKAAAAPVTSELPEVAGN